MKALGTVLGTALGLALLILLLAGGYLLLEYVGSAFSALAPQTRTLAAIGSGVLLLSAVIVAEGLKALGRRSQDVAAERTTTYQRLLSFCCEPARCATVPNVALAEIERVLALQGSAKVITAYLEVRRVAQQSGPSSETPAALLKTLVMEMRGDLGRLESFRRQNDLLELLGDRGPTASSSHLEARVEPHA